MSPPPSDPRIYHITHVDNLPAIIAAGRLYSDARMIAAGGPRTAIGMSRLKQRRLTLPVNCHPGDHVGDYVPFYFSPRSVMLYVIHRGSSDLTYTGGQDQIVYLEADLHAVVARADAARPRRRWAFSLSNAAARYAQFRADLSALDEIDWAAVATHSWGERDVKEAKQAEFLVRNSFPWSLVSRIGVRSMQIQEQVEAALAAADHRPPVRVFRDWYY